MSYLVILETSSSTSAGAFIATRETTLGLSPLRIWRSFWKTSP
ncbi:9559_t:CDS:2 [Acaulospora morrowiae]|uniref:9559_t:CDS:1 n=1 Tax=Acaulospora morrowiae TaxID=94023 RepID=A0A9N9FI09_9GLOM|nr:9559_t:CDS:2 [Acaulospora morrowiae]